MVWHSEQPEQQLDHRAPKKSSARLWRMFMSARIMTANVVLLLQAFINALANTNNGWSIALCTAYLCATLWVWRSIWSNGKPLEKTV